MRSAEKLCSQNATIHRVCVERLLRR